jgi:hypothetical protein
MLYFEHQNAALHFGWLARDDTSSKAAYEGFKKFNEAYNIINDFGIK